MLKVRVRREIRDMDYVHTVNETIDQSKGPFSQVLAFVGDYDLTVFRHILRQIGQIEKNSIKLENKYYSANIGVQHFRDSQELVSWDKKLGLVSEIGMLVVRFNSRKDLESLHSGLHLFQCDVQTLVLDDESSDQIDFVLTWATDNEFEVVFLNPDQANREEAASLNEKYGAARLAEMLHTVDWPLKVVKMQNVTGKENTDRLLQLISQMESSSEDSDLEPDSDDVEAIWRTFTSVSMPSSTVQSPVYGGHATTETSISVEIVLNNSQNETCASKVLPETNSKRKKKKKKSKSTTIPSGSTTIEDIVKTEEGVENGVIDTLIRCVEDGTADRTIGDISKVRQEIASLPFENKSRIDKAEAIVRGMLEAMSTNAELARKANNE